jgi:hypothetical protein
MTKLRTVLSGFMTPAGTGGSRGIDRDALRLALQGLLRHHRTMMWVALAMTLVLFVAEFVIGLIYVEKPSVLAATGGAMGLTIAGSIGVVRTIARELAQVGLVVALAGELDREALKPVINALARKL